jgi:predicted ATPase/class 3 adenylate cyclase/DNA-binding CsgD family transcriptional regulator
MTSRPTGTVTFLFTDIENSTQLAREHPETWEVARSRHHAILREAIESNNGFVFQIIGDAFCAAFHKAGEALRAAIKAQQDLQDEPWGKFTIYVRMGIHTGEAEFDGNDYRGYTTLSFVQRLMSAGHGGQTLVSNTTENLLREQLPESIHLRDIGMQKFAGVPAPTRVFQVIAADLPTEFPQLRTVDNLPNNLPVQLTSFVGREKELADVRRLLQNTHLLTLIGPGGTGKTRLSIQAAGEALDQYPDGVWLVELAPILDPLLVPRTTAIAIGLRDEPQRPVIDMLCDYLHEKKILIVLDNCEHLIDACARMADRILHAAPDTRILATSREALGIGGEVTYRVPSLGLPDISHLPPLESLSQYEAVKLFIDRATAAVPTFAVKNSNAPALAQVCHHLDGIPLAIELAAAKIRVLSLEQIAKRLDDRFRLLTGGSRTVLERHQTLRAAIDWSYNLLSPAEQVLFQRLSVFVGGWTLEAAESVCSDGSVKSTDVLNLMEQLINKSLVITEEVEHASRYQMLETLRQYANEKLGESGEEDALRDKHLEYFLNLAETAAPHLIRPEQMEWLALLDADYKNLHLAFDWSLNRETANSSLNLCNALWWFWVIRCYWLEGLNWLARALAKPSQNDSKNERVSHARALYGQAQLEWQLGNFQQILSPAQASLAVALEISDKRDIAIARFFVGIALREKDYDQARSLMEQSIGEFQEFNETFWQAFSFPYLGEHLVEQAKLKNRDRAVMSLELARKAGERLILADALSFYADWLIKINRLDEAKERAEESESLYKQIGFRGSSEISFVFAWIAWSEGDTQKARSLYMEMLERHRLLGENVYRAIGNLQLGLLLMEEGDLHQAQIYLEQALALSREIEFNALSALCLTQLGNLFYLQGGLEAFKQNFRESLSLKGSFSEINKVVILAAVLGSLYIQKTESSVWLLGTIDCAEKEHDLLLSPVYKRYCGPAEVYARKTLGNAAFEASFAKGWKISLDEALDLALKAVEEITEIKLPSSTEKEEIHVPATLPSQREAEKQKYGGLTAREREVAAQIAQGKSNQAIAAELFVGLKTVEAHVTRILTKLGFTSRAQIAGWAVAKGLAEAPRDLDTLGREG